MLVRAVDFSKLLLQELQNSIEQRGIQTIEIVEQDMRIITPDQNNKYDFICCMGDTITHLPTLADVQTLLKDSVFALAPGGRLLLSFRDYTHAREGVDRFIPVRSDDRRVFTCFLEYFPTHVTVHDIIHVRDAVDCPWKLAVSAYSKVRLPPAVVLETLVHLGLDIVLEQCQAGMVTIPARKAIAP